MAGLGIVFRVPLLEVRLPQTRRQTVAIVTGRGVRASLRSMAQSKFGQLDDALRAHEAGDFRSFRAKRQAHVHRHTGKLEEDRMHVGRVAPIFPAVDPPKRRRSFGSLVDAHNKLHSAEQVNEQIAC